MNKHRLPINNTTTENISEVDTIPHYIPHTSFPYTLNLLDYIDVAQKIEALRLLFIHKDIDSCEYITELLEFLEQYRGGAR